MINEKKKETVADFLKRGGKIKKVKAGTGKEGQKAMKAFKKKYGNMKSKEAELDAKDKEEREKNEAFEHAYEMNKYMNALSFDRNTNIWAEAAKDGMDPEPVSGKKTFTKKAQEKVVINPLEKEGNSKVNEGVFDFMSKDKRDKRSKVKARAKNIANIRKSKEQEVQKMDRLAQKAAGSSLSPEDKKELGRLRSKYSDLVKKRASKMNSRPQRGG